MIHIESEVDYEAIDELRSMINGKFSDDIRQPKLFRDRILIDKLNRLKVSDPLVYSNICTLSLQVKKKSKNLNIEYRLLEKKKHSLGWLIAGMICLILTFPLFIYGNVFNLTLLEIPNLQLRKIRDVQFHSTMKYGISLVLAFIFLPVYLILSFIIFHTWWIAILVFLSLPLSGLFAWNYFIEYRRIRGGFRVRKYLNSKNEEYTQLKRDHKELVHLVESLKNE